MNAIGLDGRDGVPGEPGLDGVPGMAEWHFGSFLREAIVAPWLRAIFMRGESSWLFTLNG